MPCNMKIDKVYLFLSLIFIFTTASRVTSCTHNANIDNLPLVCFERDVLPIFQNNCAISGCHNGTGESGLILNSYVPISHAVEPGKPYSSRIYNSIIATSGEMVFQVLIKSFHFEKALMEEHFNENYMESEKFPKSVFKGKITNLASVDFSKPGKYDVTVEGDLNMHDVTNKVTAKGTIEVVAGGVNASSKFNIVPEDYKINIPGVVRDNIAKNLEVTVTMKYTPVESK